MTRSLPPLVSFTELVGTLVLAATRPVTDGSRRNARDALESRGWPPVELPAPVAVPDRRTA
ncbi:MAG TPA: hypothetical protein VGO19_02620 [Actinomycetes bacterium]|jgi:hypothetical protein